MQEKMISKFLESSYNLKANNYVVTTKVII